MRHRATTFTRSSTSIADHALNAKNAIGRDGSTVTAGAGTLS